jgi:hypothetical protein
METRNVVAVAAAWLGLASLSACTLITDANDRKVIDGPTDLEFTFTEMGVHDSLPLDVAIVSEDDILQGRARVLLPPAATPYPEVTVRLQKALAPGKNRLFFFIDSNQNNKVDGAENRIDEHLWIEDVPASGKGSFKHSINFNPFTEDDYQSLNTDVVFELPMVPANAPRLRACLAKVLDDRIQESFELHVTLAADQREVAYFKTFKGNPLPEEIRLTGVIDVPNEYRIDVIVDGEQRNSVNLEAPLEAAEFVVPANRWFLGNAADIANCRNMPAI